MAKIVFSVAISLRAAAVLVLEVEREQMRVAHPLVGVNELPDKFGSGVAIPQVLIIDVPTTAGGGFSRKMEICIVKAFFPQTGNIGGSIGTFRNRRRSAALV
jgi:hypothetical protein